MNLSSREDERARLRVKRSETRQGSAKQSQILYNKLMNWIIFALGAIGAGAISDLFRKLGSNLKDPFLSNVLFQGAGFVTAIILYFIFSKKLEGNPHGMLYAVIGGIFISIFTALSFKALAGGPGVSTVMPFLRIGVVLLVVVLGILLLKEKLTWNIALGVLLAGSGVYLLSLNK